MDYGYCPRCGVKRPDAFRWCRKCGLDFENPPKPDAASSSAPSAAQQPQRIDVRPVGDRRSMAQWTRDAMEVRCLGTIGGLVGIVIGFLVGGWIGAASHNAFVTIFAIVIGSGLGFFFGARFALGRLAK